MRRVRASSWIVAFVLLAAIAGPVRAIDEAPAWAYSMAHDLMSPYCPGRTLAECPSPQATDLRFWILTQAAAGVSETDVRGMLNDRFGDILLSAPKAEGWGLSAYAIPIAFFVLGGPVVFFVLRRISGGRDEGLQLAAAGGAGEGVASAEVLAAVGSPAADGSDADEELEQQLERELGEL